MNDLKKARATAYAQLMQMDAWHDLEKWAAETFEKSISMVDAIPANELTVGKIAEERGIRKGIRKILEQAAYVRENG